MSWQCKRLPWATKRTNAIHRPRTKAISVLLWFVTSQHAPLLQLLLRKIFSRRAWHGKTDDFSITHVSFYHSKPLADVELTAQRKFSSSEGRSVYLFIKTPYCLLKTVSLNVTSGFILVRTKAADKGFVRVSLDLHNEHTKHILQITQKS